MEAKPGPGLNAEALKDAHGLELQRVCSLYWMTDLSIVICNQPIVPIIYMNLHVSCLMILLLLQSIRVNLRTLDLTAARHYACDP